MNEELKIIISAEIDKLKKGVESAQKQVKGFKDQVKKASENVDKTFEKMGAGITNALKTVGTALAGAGAALVALGASTAEYRASQAKLVTAFETAGSTASQAKDTYNDLYRVLGDGDVAVEAAGHLAKLTTEEKALNEWTTICQGVYATFGDSLPIEGLTEAANETAKVGTLTGSLADALNWAGVNEEEFQAKLDACNTESEREALIRETLNGLYTEAAENYEKNNSQVLEQNEANAKLQETTAALGEAIAPVITAFTNFANDALAAVLPYIQELADQYLPLLKNLLTEVSDALAIAFDWISQNKEVLAIMAGIITGIATAIGLYNAVAAVKAAMDALQVTTLWGLVSALTAQAAATIAALAPYIAIVAAIAAVIAIIVLCVKNWDKIKAKVKEVAENIKQKVLEMKDKVVQWFTELKQKITDKVEELKSAAKEKFNQIKTDITDKVRGAKDKAVETFTNMKNSVKEKIDSIKQSVSNTFSNIKNDIANKISLAKTTVVNKFAEIKSSIKSKIDGAKDAVKSAIDKIKGFFDFDWELPKIKLPHFSISGSFSLNPPSIPTFGVQWYQHGGVFDKPTLFPYGDGSIGGLGENGAEAIVPLEKNTKWLDKMADRVAARVGGNTPVVLNVDGKVFAQTTIDTLNAYTRQTGSLPLKLA